MALSALFKQFKQLFPQPAIACMVSLLAVAGSGYAWAVQGTGSIGTGMPHMRDLLLAAVLVAGVVVSYRFPIHLNRSRKVEISSVPLYLIAALLPGVPLAATAAGLGILIGELMVRVERGNYYSDVFTAVSRWVIVIMAGSTFAHLYRGYAGYDLHLHAGTPLISTTSVGFVGTALILWAGDCLTCPLVISPMSGERPVKVIITNSRDSAPIEGAQYLFGLLGALAASVEYWSLGLLVLPAVLVYRAFKTIKEIQNNTFAMLESMADAVDLRDPYTGGHSRRVSTLVADTLRTMGIHGPEAELVVAASRVHDIGKIGIPDSILNKPDRLTPEEEALMQTHPDRGADLLARHINFKRGVDIVRHHHERWDGKGYPHGLRGTDIPFGARVIAVADSFDAMTSDRPYRRAIPPATALSILREGRGTQWDPIIVDAFLRTMGQPAPVDRPISPPAELVLPGSQPAQPLEGSRPVAV
jgi:hypothetical protein